MILTAISEAVRIGCDCVRHDFAQFFKLGEIRSRLYAEISKFARYKMSEFTIHE